MSGGQASYVLERLIADRRISASDVNRYVGDMHREIKSLESRLQMLRTSASSPSSTSSASRTSTASTASSGSPTGRRRGRPPGSGKRRGRPRGTGRKAAPAAVATTSAPAAAAATGKRRRRSRITAEQLASRQLQGRYLGLIRQIPASKRAPYQRIAKEKGREAAINEMKSAVKK